MDAGPILIQHEHRIPAPNRAAFLEAMKPVRGLRLRDGAMRWALFEEPEADRDGTLKFVECYLHSSMGEHLRQHRRATDADCALLLTANSLGSEPWPKVRHLVVVGDQDTSLLQKIWLGGSGV